MIDNKYPNLFTPLEVNGKVLRNRIFSAPNMLFQIVDGRPTDYYVGYLEEKARGGAAVVNLGEVTVCDGASHIPAMELNEANRNILGEMAAVIKEHGALASAELTHAGRKASPKYNKGPLIGPVDEVTARGNVIHAMTKQDMEDVAESFAQAAIYMRDCGFDMAHIHAGHGWLFPQFLSPIVNTRTDEYGGSLENRMRFPLECLKHVREKVGKKFIISMRLSGGERCEGGFTTDDIIEFLDRAQEYIDLVEITTEVPEYTMPSAYLPWGHNVLFSEKIKASGRIRIPVFILGSIVEPGFAEEIIASGKADGVSMSRALIADPALPGKARAGASDDIRPCLRCLCCTDGDNVRKFFRCSVNPVTAHETRMRYNGYTEPAAHRRKVVVVGGGPGGMVSAITAVRRGHEVILCERGRTLGGTINYAADDPLKKDLNRYKAYLIRQVEKNGINVRLNTEATADYIKKEQPDHVIIATGAKNIVPTFLPGYERGYDILDSYFHPETVKGDNIVIIGAGLSGVEAGIYQAEVMGRKVTILEKFTKLNGVGTTYGWGVNSAVSRNNIEILEGVDCEKITDEGVVYSKDGVTKTAKADTVLFAMGRRSVRDLYFEIASFVPFVDLVGDSKQVSQVGSAVTTGYAAAMNIGIF